MFSKLKSLLVPSDGETPVPDRSRDLSRQDLLDALMKHFSDQMRLETTRVSLLFHTSYVIYLRQSDYERISPGFQITVNDAVTIFLECVKNMMDKYPNYKPHAKYWVFQLVGIPDGTAIDGVPDDEMASGTVFIKSSIFAVDDYSSGDAGGGRIVTTMHTVNSMKAMPNAMNLSALPGLIQLDKDKYRIRFDPENLLGFGLEAVPAEEPLSKPVARITADDGRFFSDGRTFTVYQMKGDSVRISGRNAVMQRGIDTLCVDSEEVMNPHVVIRRDQHSGMFSLAAVGPTKLNERTVMPGITSWTPLPDNSVILINDEIQLSFKMI